VVQLSDAETAIMEVGDMSPQKGRLIIRNDGEVIQEQPLNRERERILIGRDALSDIRIAADLVSRHHALIVISSNGVTLVDLGSTNGTFVDGREIKQCELEDRQVIGIGDCQIEYLAGDERQPGFGDVDSTNEFKPDDADAESPDESLDAELHSLELELEPEPDKTKVSAGRRARR
jgi:pSer/pThr/pTyr-binding forkhead associated (FHA) protein